MSSLLISESLRIELEMCVIQSEQQVIDCQEIKFRI